MSGQSAGPLRSSLRDACKTSRGGGLSLKPLKARRQAVSRPPVPVRPPMLPTTLVPGSGGGKLGQRSETLVPMRARARAACRRGPAVPVPPRTGLNAWPPKEPAVQPCSPAQRRAFPRCRGGRSVGAAFMQRAETKRQRGQSRFALPAPPPPPPHQEKLGQDAHNNQAQT